MLRESPQLFCSLKSLNLSANNLGDGCMSDVGDLVKSIPSLEKIRLNSNEITNKGIESLFPCLFGNTTLRYLGLSQNPEITNYELFEELASASAITNVSVEGTGVTFEQEAEIKRKFHIPIDSREIPIMSNSKSAAKSSSN